MWDERYGATEYAYGAEPSGFLVDVAGRIPRGPVLSLGEGEGRNAVYLAGLGYDVTALDSSAVGLDKARKLAAERNVAIRTVHADVENFDIERGKWAAIVSIFLHLPREARRLLHARCVAGLGPGGLFILEAYSPRQLQFKTGGPSRIDLLVDLESLRSELEGLRLERALETVRQVHEGRFHDGPGAVVQVLGVKPAIEAV
jgi:SAM-dependent methyltransferase